MVCVHLLRFPLPHISLLLPWWPMWLSGWPTGLSSWGRGFMSLRNAAVRVDASRRNGKLVAKDWLGSPDGRLSWCSVRSWNNGHPGVVPWAHLCLSIWLSRVPIWNLCSRFCATWSRTLSFPHTRKVPWLPAPVTPYPLARCAVATSVAYLTHLTPTLPRNCCTVSTMDNRHMSAFLLRRL